MRKWLDRLKKSMTTRKLAAALSVFFLFALHIGFVIALQESTSYTPCAVMRGDVRRTLTFNGAAKVKNQKLVYARYASKVRRIFVREGEKVQMGSRLVLLENGKVITSEMNGYVGKINVREQENVTENTNLLELYDLNQMTGEFDINEYDIASIYIGQDCQVSIPSGGQKLTSKISSINMNARQEGGLAIFKVGVDLDELEGINLLPGIQLYLSVDTEVIENCAYIPAKAIMFNEMDEPYVIIKKYNRYEHLPVSVDLYNGEYAAIREGLEELDTVYVPDDARGEGSLLDNP